MKLNLKVSLDKNRNISILKGDVEIKTSDGKTIKTDYAEYNKNKFFILKTNVSLIDAKTILLRQFRLSMMKKIKFLRQLDLLKALHQINMNLKVIISSLIIKINL